MKIKKFGVVAMAAVAVAAATVLGAWASNDDHTHSDADYLFNHLQARSHALDAVWIESSLAEMLPSRQFSFNGGPATARAAGVAIGRIVDVQEGRGFAHKDDAPTSTLVGFNDKSALWRTVEVTVAVEESWGKIAGQQQLTFAVVIDRGANARNALNGLRGLGRIVVSLDRQGRYGYAPDLYSISRSGDLFGTVDARGNIQLPVMENGAGFMNGVDTLAELRAEATKTPEVIRVGLTEGVPVRR